MEPRAIRNSEPRIRRVTIAGKTRAHGHPL